MGDKENSYWEGHAAYGHADENPYLVGSLDWRRWELGYEHAAQEALTWETL